MLAYKPVNLQFRANRRHMRTGQAFTGSSSVRVNLPVYTTSAKKYPTQVGMEE